MKKPKFYRTLVGLLFSGWMMITIIHQFDHHHHFIRQKLFEALETGTYSAYTHSLRALGRGKFTSAKEVVSPEAGAINIGFIIVNRKNTQFFDDEFARRTTETLRSLLLHANTSTPLHFVILTDEFSRTQVGHLMVSLVSKIISHEVIKMYNRKKHHLPRLYFSLVDFHEIASVNQDFINAFKAIKAANMDKIDMELEDKYSKDFFYIAPFYHQALTSLDKIIFMDCFDLEFKTDIGELAAEFTNLEQTSAAIGIGLDLSPYYKTLMKTYNKAHNSSKLGQPGRFQGFNSGVVLFHLERLRNSPIYNRYLNADEVNILFGTYYHVPTVGDQDWFTDLGFKEPDLFYLLPCQFNTQTSLQYMNMEFKDTFDDYHYCDHFSNVKILHLNGCGPLPSNCENEGDPSTKRYREGSFYALEETIDWRYFVDSKWRSVGYKMVNLYFHRGGSIMHTY